MERVREESERLALGVARVSARRTVTRCMIASTLMISAPTVALHAQARAPEPAGTAVLLLADSLTLGDYCNASRNVMALDTVRKLLGVRMAEVQANVDKLCDPRVAAFTLRTLTGDQPASFAAVARREQEAFHEVARVPLRDVTVLVDRELRSDDDMRRAIRAASPAVAAPFVKVTEVARRLFFDEAGARSLKHLANYERKLGPQAPQLNGVEVLLNYAAQRWVPGFAPSIKRGPSPLELVVTYVPTYATGVDRKAVAVSASEFGVRGYLFGDNWGKTGVEGILKPAYWSLGALVASDRNGALAWPWDGRTRTGVFVGWGETKVGYIAGRKGSLLVTRQVQFIPYLF